MSANNNDNSASTGDKIKGHIQNALHKAQDAIHSNKTHQHTTTDRDAKMASGSAQHEAKQANNNLGHVHDQHDNTHFHHAGPETVGPSTGPSTGPAGAFENKVSGNPASCDVKNPNVNVYGNTTDTGAPPPNPL